MEQEINLGVKIQVPEMMTHTRPTEYYPREPRHEEEKVLNLGGNRTHDLSIGCTVALANELRSSVGSKEFLLQS